MTYFYWFRRSSFVTALSKGKSARSSFLKAICIAPAFCIAAAIFSFAQDQTKPDKPVTSGSTPNVEHANTPGSVMVTPDKPDKPATPDKPAAPDKPDKPNIEHANTPGSLMVTPDKPDKPDTQAPDKPDKPEAPDRPDNSDGPGGKKAVKKNIKANKDKQKDQTQK